MKRLGKFFQVALFTPIYTNAPPGHNNRVLLARAATVFATGVVAGVVAVIGVAAIRYPGLAAAAVFLAVGFACGFLARKFADRFGLVASARETNLLPPLTKTNHPS